MAIDKKEVLKELVDTNGSHFCLSDTYQKVCISAYINNGIEVKFYDGFGKSYNISELNLGISSGYNSNGKHEFI